jgi:hypothetical protein
MKPYSLHFTEQKDIWAWGTLIQRLCNGTVAITEALENQMGWEDYREWWESRNLEEDGSGLNEEATSVFAWDSKENYVQFSAKW